ncbi:MAG: sulfurtransferase TusA family protein [Chloroflexi bacterium]|nr:sulfurtransferase TusA family protein [Chloroflexota bacterium]MCL5108890.1 sulfurtransferase TusA family protein [Chloroflexota bacterium]
MPGTVTRWDRELDLTGEVCPMTFVKTKLALEGMAPGQVLRVILDFAEAVESVPRSARNEGHRVLGVVQTEDNQWTVLIRRG